jgi:hypothetical protein
VLTRVHKLLTTELAHSCQRKLGIIRQDGEFSIRQVRQVIEAIKRKSSSGCKNVRW